jgi:RHS repeat-associated protein
VASTYSYIYQSGTSLITSVTDSLNRTTAYTYDQLGNVLTITQLAGTPNAFSSSATYEAKFSQMTSFTDPLNHTSTFTYDSKGNQLSVTDPLGDTSNRTYNVVGQMISSATSLGETTTLNWDGGDLTSITDPLGRTNTFFADAVGRRISSTNPAGALTRYTYDTLNRITQLTDANGAITSYSYDPDGHLLTVTDARNTANPTTYAYDNTGRVITMTDPLGKQETTSYDGNNNILQFTDRRGKVSKFVYDALNRRTFAGFGFSGTTYESTVNYGFDAGNRMIQAVDSSSGTTTRNYDGLDHLTSEMSPGGTVAFTYDNSCRRTSFTPPGQPVVNYTYDAANRLTQIMQGATTVHFVYDADGRRQILLLPNGIMGIYTYDAASELVGLTYNNGSTTIGSLSYGFDVTRRRSSVTGSLARTNLPSPVSVFTYNVANELTTWGTANLFYDANGNMTSDGTHSYTWDARGHLSSIDSGATASFSYDPFGRRVSKTILGSTTTFVYDGANAIQEVIGGSNVANSIMGKTDEVFQRTDSAGSFSFLTDAVGSTLALSDSTGSLAAQYTFDPFGNTTASGSSSSNSFDFAGRELDQTGLYFNRARYYSPALQRFVSEDPIGLKGGINTFVYARNNPTNRRDAFGLCPGCGFDDDDNPGGAGGQIPGDPAGCQNDWNACNAFVTNFYANQLAKANDSLNSCLHKCVVMGGLLGKGGKAFAICAATCLGFYGVDVGAARAAESLGRSICDAKYLICLQGFQDDGEL